jgi:hypothetical protein
MLFQHRAAALKDLPAVLGLLPPTELGCSLEVALSHWKRWLLQGGCRWASSKGSMATGLPAWSVPGSPPGSPTRPWQGCTGQIPAAALYSFTGVRRRARRGCSTAGRSHSPIRVARSTYGSCISGPSPTHQIRTLRPSSSSPMPRSASCTTASECGDSFRKCAFAQSHTVSGQTFIGGNTP